MRHTVFRAWADFVKQKKAVEPIIARMMLSRRTSLVAVTFHAWRRFVSACRLERMKSVIEVERQRRVAVRCAVSRGTMWLAPHAATALACDARVS